MLAFQAYLVTGPRNHPAVKGAALRIELPAHLHGPSLLHNANFAPGEFVVQERKSPRPSNLWSRSNKSAKPARTLSTQFSTRNDRVGSQPPETRGTTERNGPDSAMVPGGASFWCAKVKRRPGPRADADQPIFAFSLHNFRSLLEKRAP